MFDNMPIINREEIKNALEFSKNQVVNNLDTFCYMHIKLPLLM